MGCSGAAFDFAINEETWDPLAATPRDEATLRRGASAVGVRLDAVPPPYDDEMRALVLDRVMESINLDSAPLARGLVGPAEYGLIVGYDTSEPVFLVRTYFDRGPEPTRVGWDAFVDEEHGTPIFLDPAPAPDRSRAALAGLDAGVAAAERSLDALRSWVAGLRDDARWSDVRHAGQAAFADHSMRTILADKRRSAARFLRGLRALLPASPGADVLRAAESYGYVADAAGKHGTGEFDAAVAMRFIDTSHRRGWGSVLEGAIAHEAEAQSALAAARAAAR
ncbi:hypothetical protein BH18CHL2_BH18CHL2_03750 [soil metagenome]